MIPQVPVPRCRPKTGLAPDTCGDLARHCGKPVDAEARWKLAAGGPDGESEDLFKCCRAG